MNGPMSTVSEINSAAVSSENYCDPCRRIQENVQAKFWCETCLELLCQYCVKTFHKRLKNSDFHQLKSVTDEDDTLEVLLFNYGESCTEHDGKMYEVYCKEHNQMCCVVCLAKNHRTCQNILTIDEVVESVSSEKHRQKTLTHLSILSEEVQTLIDNKNIKIVAIKNRKDLLMKQSEIRIDSAIDTLQKIKLELRDRLSRVCSLETKPFEKQIENFDLFHGIILQNIRCLTNVNKHGDAKQVFFTLQKIRKCLQVQRERFLKTAEDLDTVFMDVEFDIPLDTFNREPQTYFKITLKHARGWREYAKKNILQKLANLEKYFTHMTDTETEDKKRDQISEIDVCYDNELITSEQTNSDSSENEPQKDVAEDSDNLNEHPSNIAVSIKHKQKDKRDRRRRRHHRQTTSKTR